MQMSYDRYDKNPNVGDIMQFTMGFHNMLSANGATKQGIYALPEKSQSVKDKMSAMLDGVFNPNAGLDKGEMKSILDAAQAMHEQARDEAATHAIRMQTAMDAQSKVLTTGAYNPSIDMIPDVASVLGFTTDQSNHAPPAATPAPQSNGTPSKTAPATPALSLSDRAKARLTPTK